MRIASQDNAKDDGLGEYDPAKPMTDTGNIPYWIIDILPKQVPADLSRIRNCWNWSGRSPLRMGFSCGETD